MPSSSPSAVRDFLAEAGDRHAAWLAGADLAPRTRRTYGQQVGWYLAWLDGRPRIAARLRGPAASHWYARGRGGLAARGVTDADALARQRAADRAAGLYHQHLADGGAAAASVKLALSAVGSLYSALGLRAPLVLDRAGTRPYSRPRTLSPAERDRVLAAAGQRGPRDHALAALAADPGLRPGEIVAVDRADVRPGAAAIRVPGGTYAHRTRVVPLTTAAARAAVMAYCLERDTIQAPDPALFLTRRGTRITLRTVQHIVARAGAATGTRVSPITLRNTRAAELADGGMSPHELARRLGHARAETVRPFAPATPPPGGSAVLTGSGPGATGGPSEHRQLAGPAA